MKHNVPGCSDNHVFSCSVYEPDCIFMSPAVGEPGTKVEMVKKEYQGTKWAANMASELLPLPKLGLKDIKWAELYDKWRQFVPPAKCLEFKPFHEPPGPARRAKIKANVEAADLARKKRSSTNTVSQKENEEAVVAAKIARQEKAAATRKSKQEAATQKKEEAIAKKAVAAEQKRVAADERKRVAESKAAEKKKRKKT